jgi:hypothetical protein
MAGSLAARVLLLNPFDRYAKRYFVRDGRQERFHFKITPLKGGRCLPSRTKLTLRARTAPDCLDVQRQRLGNTTERKISGYFIRFIVDFLYRGALEGRARKLSGVEEIGTLDVFIAVGKIGVDAVGLYLDADCILRCVILIEREGTIKGIEPAVDVTDPEMSDLKYDCGVDWVDLEGIRVGKRCPGEGEETQWN